MTLTKEEAIRRHRLMWNWIAQMSIQEQRCVSKPEAFKHFGWEDARSDCWCCEFADTQTMRGCSRYSEMCQHCPIMWPDLVCSNGFDFLYDKVVDFSWDKLDENNYVKMAKYAYKIADLPERKE